MKRIRYKRLPWALALACAPLVSLAQAEESEPEASVAEPEEGVVHRVVEGDTLWDITGRYLGNPFDWPRVWSYNPEIENPHWIFPGDRVRLGPAQPAAVPVATEEEPIFEEDLVEVPDVAVVGKIGYHKAGRRFRTDGVITRAGLEASGRITNAFEEKELLAEGDRVYLEWPDRRSVKLGETYVVFRPEGRIYHPVTEAFLGHHTRILGTVQVVEISPFRKHVVGVIRSSFEEIGRGDRIGPSLGDLERPVEPRPNPRNMVGRIAATVDRGVRELGQDQIVILDRGKQHGVQVGNVFQVVQAGDGLYASEDEPVSDLPGEIVAELLVLDVFENTSTASVVAARREVHVGDRVVMRAASR